MSIREAEAVTAVRGVDTRRLTLAATRIESLDEVWRYISAIDFKPLKVKICDSPADGGLGWSMERADYAEQQYKRWLFLRRKYEARSLPPSAEIDDLWHAHILDTQAYHRDCSYVFGEYFHHFPYFGMRGHADAKALAESFEATHEHFRREFGEPLYDFE
jgi:hypothetical protein